MELSKKDIEHIAELARLELSEQEYEKYGEQLSGVLSYIEQLNEVDTDMVEPTAQVTGLENVLREDKAEPWQEDERKAALNEAPELDNDMIKVKRVLK